MNFDPITNAVVTAIQRSMRRYEHVQISRTVTATGSGTAVLRAMGAGGGGGKGLAGNYAKGGNGGTVAIKTITVAAGDQFVVTIPAGGAGATTDSTPGSTGGTLTVVRSGVTLLSIPGGNGGPGVDVGPTNNSAPVGADWYVLGGLAGYGHGSGGGGAMLVEGGALAGKGGDSPASGGGGALGNGGAVANGGGGGATQHASGVIAGGGYMSPGSCILRFAPAVAAQRGTGSGSAQGRPSLGAFAGGHGEAGGAPGNGGFGGGGGGGGGSGGNGGFGGGGGGGSGGGFGGQGWLTIEWQGGAA